MCSRVYACYINKCACIHAGQGRAAAPQAWEVLLTAQLGAIWSCGSLSSPDPYMMAEGSLEEAQGRQDS